MFGQLVRRNQVGKTLILSIRKHGGLTGDEIRQRVSKRELQKVTKKRRLSCAKKPTIKRLKTVTKYEILPHFGKWEKGWNFILSIVVHKQTWTHPARIGLQIVRHYENFYSSPTTISDFMNEWSRKLNQGSRGGTIGLFNL